jgi:hypothetical protein
MSITKKIFNRSFGLMLLFLIVTVISSCNKAADQTTNHVQNMARDGHRGATLTQTLTVATVREGADKTTQALFLENAEIFHVTDAATLSVLNKALSGNKKVNVVLDPWNELVLSATIAADAPAHGEILRSIPESARRLTPGAFNPSEIDGSAAEIEKLGPLPSSSPLTAVIPDMATARVMFSYITSQCCAVAGPYSIDYCIPFQYVRDGCYARAEKMCWILNTKYHYDTRKIYSFANSGGASLSVKGDKWGGCCINWWYHVAPLVTIRTASGPKPYVFDPGMFDEPMPLSEWLHAQENPACAGYAHVSMYNIQPTTAYCPADYSGYSFATDPGMVSTNSTLTSYRSLTTCP